MKKYPTGPFLFLMQFSLKSLETIGILYQSKSISRNYDYLKELSIVCMNSYVFLAYFYAIGYLPKCHLFLLSGQIKKCVESAKWRCWVRLIGDIFLSTQKTYHGLRCTISRNYHGRCCWDDLLWQNLLNDLRSWGAGLKTFILSLILLQCCGDAGGILCGHYSGVKFVNLSDKIVPVNGFWPEYCSPPK